MPRARGPWPAGLLAPPEAIVQQDTMEPEEQKAQATEAGELEAADQAAEARREVLRRIGVFGAATAPLLLGALKAEQAVAQTGSGIPGGGTGVVVFF